MNKYGLLIILMFVSGCNFKEGKLVYNSCKSYSVDEIINMTKEEINTLKVNCNNPADIVYELANRLNKIERSNNDK